MHPLINREMVEEIRRTGKAVESLPDRAEVLERYRLPFDRQAENVIISGCQILSLLPHVLASLARLYERAGFSYTFLSRENCCGNYLYRPALAARDEEALEECRELSKEFLGGNLEAARDLGARRLVIFCSPCYPIYRHAFPREEIVFYPVSIAEVMGEAEYRGRVDYYAGCYRLHRRLSPAPMDLESTDEVLGRIKGLEVNRIGAPSCCYKPEGISHLVDNIRTGHLVTVCTGCYGQALANLSAAGDTEILMLPQFVEEALEGR